jgi:hypothetical protein
MKTWFICNMDKYQSPLADYCNATLKISNLSLTNGSFEQQPRLFIDLFTT